MLLFVQNYRIRLATQLDASAVDDLSHATGLSDGDEHPSSLAPMDDEHTWIVLENDSNAVIGAAYFGPEGHSDRVWNLYFLAVHPQHQGGGTGSALVAWVEANLRDRGEDVAKLLLIETSSVESFAPTRSFYRKLGYVEEARVREYYGPGDDKVVFWKMLNLTPISG
jgi:ribosomal protein S18 acetylase RimI-like enzyme